MSRSAEMNHSHHHDLDAQPHYEGDNSVSTLRLIDAPINSNESEPKFALNDYLPDKLEVELKFEMDIDPSQEPGEFRDSMRKKLRLLKKLPPSLGRIGFREKTNRLCRRPFSYDQGQYIFAKWSCTNAHVRGKISLSVTLTMSGTRACRVLFFPEYTEKSGPYNQSNFIPILSSGDYQQYRHHVLLELDTKIAGIIDFLGMRGFKYEYRKLTYVEIAYDLHTHNPDPLFEDLTSSIYDLSRDAIRKEHKDGYEQFCGKLDHFCEATCYRKTKDRIRLEIRVSDKKDTNGPLSQAFIAHNFRLVEAVPAVADFYWQMKVQDFSQIPDNYKDQSLEVNANFIRVFVLSGLVRHR